jgi:predicted nuclease with TOPRIM domain
MITAKEFLKLKDQLEKLKEEYHQAQGARDNLLARLQSDHQCNSTEEGQKKLMELEEQIRHLSKSRDSKLSRFEKKWSSKLK